MPIPVVRLATSSRAVRAGLDRIRDEMKIPREFPVAVTEAARSAARQPIHQRANAIDAREIPFLTIDPPGSRDLDQAFHAERTADGFRVQYAIADVACFVGASDLVDVEAHERGVTVYLPDRRAPLYPPTIGEGAASLLPRRDRPALLWTIDLDAEGVPTTWRLEPATVRSRRALTYAGVQRSIDRGTAAEPLVLLREIGLLRDEQERRRGGISIAAPVQELVRRRGAYLLSYEVGVPVERWNAQISLLAGMCAATTMIDAGVGILRTLPPADPVTLDRLKRVAASLDITWSPDQTYPDVVRSLTPGDPHHAAFLTEALELFRGAGYTVVDAHTPTPGSGALEHAAIGARYAHVTAPLRRLADRYANEVVLAACADATPPSWAVDALATLPEIMGRSGQRAANAERAALDLIECIVLQPHVGEVFAATVVDLDGDRAVLQLSMPPVIATVASDGLSLGSSVKARLDAVNPEERRLELTVVSSG
jgi:exoribonuclease R